MRLDHLLSKDRFVGVASWLFVVWIVDGSGPARGLALAEELGGRLVLWFPACVVGLGWLACLVVGVEDTPAAAWLVVVVGAPACVGVACCRGSGAVRPGCLARVLLLVCGWWGWVWVGWL